MQGIEKKTNIGIEAINIQCLFGSIIHSWKAFIGTLYCDNKLYVGLLQILQKPTPFFRYIYFKNSYYIYIIFKFRHEDLHLCKPLN